MSIIHLTQPSSEYTISVILATDNLQALFLDVWNTLTEADKTRIFSYLERNFTIKTAKLAKDINARSSRFAIEFSEDIADWHNTGAKFIIAHELAHLCLGHVFTEPEDNMKAERAAFAKSLEWLPNIPGMDYEVLITYFELEAEKIKKMR